jgi:hypothetical protein
MGKQLAAVLSIPPTLDSCLPASAGSTGCPLSSTQVLNFGSSMISGPFSCLPFLSSQSTIVCAPFSTVSLPLFILHCPLSIVYSPSFVFHSSFSIPHLIVYSPQSCVLHAPCFLHPTLSFFSLRLPSSSSTHHFPPHSAFQTIHPPPSTNLCHPVSLYFIPLPNLFPFM